MFDIGRILYTRAHDTYRGGLKVVPRLREFSALLHLALPGFCLAKQAHLIARLCTDIGNGLRLCCVNWVHAAIGSYDAGIAGSL